MKAIFGDKVKRFGLLAAIILVFITLYYQGLGTNDSVVITDTVAHPQQQKKISISVTKEPFLDKIKLNNLDLAPQPIENGFEEDGGPYVLPKLKATESDTSTKMYNWTSITTSDDISLTQTTPNSRMKDDTTFGGEFTEINDNDNYSIDPNKPTTPPFQKNCETLNLSPRHICNCTDRMDNIIQQDQSENQTSLVVESSCSDEATLLGKYQKVVSYSLYVNPKKPGAFDSKYFFGAAGNVEGVKKYYPGWVMRIYSNIDLEPHNEMCALVCSDPNIYYCDARRLPRLGNLSQIHPNTWRFMPLGDETVDKFIVRDLDSRISQRERDAVSEWEASQYAFHGMRDHKAHNTQIMGGMWGGNNFELGFHTARKLQKEFINIRTNKDDQYVLTTVIYRLHKDQLLTHDSYKCGIFKDSPRRPFPTRRDNISAFVGQQILQNKTTYPVVQKCPKSCRPPGHQDWEYC